MTRLRKIIEDLRRETKKIERFKDEIEELKDEIERQESEIADFEEEEEEEITYEEEILESILDFCFNCPLKDIFPKCNLCYLNKWKIENES